MPEEKLPPHDYDAEEAVIGSLLLRGSTANPVEVAEAMSEVSELKTSDFYREKNKPIIEAIRNLYQSGIGIDQITVAHRLREQENLESIGGPAYLIHCLNSVATSYHLKYYAGIVLSCSGRRKMLEKAKRLVQDAYADGISTSTIPNKELKLPPIKKG